MSIEPMNDETVPAIQPQATLDRVGHFRGFQDLMLWRVENIVLVSSLYDSFVLAEGGHVTELILAEFLGMNLHHIPNIMRVSTGAEALEFVRQHLGNTLIITAPHVGDMDAAELARSVNREAEQIPVVVLAYDNRELSDFVKESGLADIDRAFLWQGDSRILLAIVKYIEDLRNVAHDVEVMGVQVILVIEDNIRSYSALLPEIYTEVVAHMRSLVPESVNISHKLLRIKARPKILLADNYEDAWKFFSEYQQNILGVLSDVQFQKDGERCPDAGVQFARKVMGMQTDVPVLLHSSKPANEKLADELGVPFLLKGAPTMLSDLRHFMLANFGFGDFVFRLADGQEVARAHNLRSLEKQLRDVPAESIAYHSARNHFSVWLKAHTEFAVAHRLRPRKLEDFETLEDLRQDLIYNVRLHRQQRTRAAVTDFDPERYDPTRGISRIGGGSVGGKARGLAFANLLLTEFHIDETFPAARIFVPPCVVLATDIFDEFIEQNDLLDFAMSCTDDAELEERFLGAGFPEGARDSLRAFLEMTDYPLAVRSSSLLEDSKYQPFAGIYETHMLPNNHSEIEVRLGQLLRAVKEIYASTFCVRAKQHVVSTPYRLEEEKMAVILQQLAGSRHGNRFYPEFAGAALSQNFYPTGKMKPEDGMVAVALGLGPMVVEGEQCLRFSPAYPEHIVQFSSVKDTLKNTQREFYALHLPDGSEEETEFSGSSDADLLRLDLHEAEVDGTLTSLGSTYSPENDAIFDGISRPGVRLVTFAPILKYGAFPLAGILQRLLEIGAYASGVPVEIEFAVNLSTPKEEPEEFAFLQLRPVARASDLVPPDLGELDESELVCHSDSVLGNGIIEDTHDIVVVDYHRFERAQSLEVAQEVSRFDARLQEAEVPYILIGVGRWGSSEPLLGIPVTWEQISGARVIVETGFRDFKVTPSQGTHFFQNLVSHSVGYFTINPELGDGFIDWFWLTAQPSVTETEFVRHLHFDEPVVVKMDGSRNEGIIIKPPD
jgi:CheY-like chemotaxis protein